MIFTVVFADVASRGGDFDGFCHIIPSQGIAPQLVDSAYAHPLLSHSRRSFAEPFHQMMKPAKTAKICWP